MIPAKVELPKGKGADIMYITMALIAVFIVLTVFGAFGKLTDSIKSLWGGDKESKEVSEDLDNALKKLSNLKSGNPLAPDLYNENFGKYKLTTLSQKTAKEYAIRIHDSVGLLKDSPAQALSTIRLCKNQIQVSQVANEFQKTYSRSMVDYLQEHFDTNDQKRALIEIAKQVSLLPTGIDKKTKITSFERAAFDTMYKALKGNAAAIKMYNEKYAKPLGMSPIATPPKTVAKKPVKK